MNVNPWVLLPAECQQNEGQFILLQPVNGLVSGEQARPFFLKSGLPSNVLAQIWQLSDLNKDGKLDCLEFCIAMRLIRNCLSEIPLPPALPESMKRLPQQSPMPQFPPRPMSAYGGPLPANYGSVNAQLYSSTTANVSYPTTPSTVTIPSFTMGIKELGNWSIPQHLKLRFSQQFNHLDKNRVGLLTGAQARGALGESQLPTHILAQIWALTDVNKSGCLSIEQFCAAMFLIEMIKSGYALPTKIPPELSSFCHRNKTTSPLATDPTMPPPQKGAAIKTFEDKRRDNLDRGQAELERRRQILREEEERRRAEIERKEREEEERKERERLELEMKREAEREMERQREMERERERAAEEERIKTEREEARRRLEQERIKELEKIRIRDLESQHQNELEKTTQFQQRHKTMTFQLQAMEEKSQQLSNEIVEARDQIIAITSEIEGMRGQRDQKLMRINELQTKSQQLAVQCERVGHENLQLQSECQKTLCRTQEIEKIREAIVECAKQTAANNEELSNVKERFMNQEKQVADKRVELDENKKQLKAVFDAYNILVDEFAAMKEEAKRRAASKRKPSTKVNDDAFYALPPDGADIPQLATANFGDAFPSNSSTVVHSASGGFETDFSANFPTSFSDANFISAQPPALVSSSLYATPPDAVSTVAATTTMDKNGAANANTAPIEPVNSTSIGSATTRYRALYEFVARSEDELSLQPGDSILVFENHVSEPGWLAGQIKEKVGWFPASFAERMQETTTSSSIKPPNSIPTSPSSVPLEIIKEEPHVEKEIVTNFRESTQIINGNGLNNAIDLSKLSSAGALYDAPPGDGPPIEADSKPIVKHEAVLAVGTALYQWKARNDSDLSFNRNDIIEVLEQGEMRWRGRLQKEPTRQGWFPKSYIKLDDKLANMNTAKNGEKKKEIENKVVPPDLRKKSSIELKHEKVNESENVYVAMYQFDAVEATDLSLKPGDIIQVIESNDEWWKGSCNGKTGIFPANYVQKMSALRTQEKQSLGRALAAFEATGPNQISLRVGELVRIHNTSPGGWWEGEVEHDGVKLNGWFPGNYIQVLNEDGSVSSINPTPNADGVILATVLFDYNAQHVDELSFKAGDVIDVVDTSAGLWWKGRKYQETTPGSSGTPPLLFPANFVQLR